MGLFSSTHHTRAVLGLDDRQFKAGMKRASGSWKRFSGSLVAGLGPIAGAAGFGLLTRAIVKTGATFEQSMANIRAVTRSTDEQMQSMEATARRLGATTSFAANEVADGMTVLAKATGSAEKAVSGIEAVLKLAGSEGADMTQTAELMISTMNAFSISFDDSARVANTFAAVAQNTRQSVERLADGMKNAAPISREFGLSFEEVTAALGLLVDSGLEASQAGTLLRSALSDILRASGPLGDALKGVDTRAAGLAGVLDTLSEAGIRGTDTYKNFNVRGAQVVSILQRQSDRLRELTGDITGTSAAWEAYDVQQNTVIGAAKRVMSAFQEVAITLFSVFSTDLRTAGDTLAKFINDHTREIGEFVIDIRTNFKIATAYVRAYADEFGSLVASIQAGLEAADIGGTIRRALTPEVLKTGVLGFQIGDSTGTNAAQAFASAFAAEWRNQTGRGLQISTSEATGFLRLAEGASSEVEAAIKAYQEEGEKAKEKLAGIDLTGALTKDPTEEIRLNLAGSALILDGFYSEWNQKVKDSAAGRATNERQIMHAGTNLTLGGLRRQIGTFLQWQRAAYSGASAAIQGVYMDFFNAVTDMHITGAERWKQIAGSVAKAWLSVLNRMIAQTIAAKIQLESILAGLSTGSLFGLGIIGVGLGAILSHNLFHSGGTVPGSSSQERLAMVRGEEEVIPPGPANRYRDLLRAISSGFEPEMAFAGGAPHVEVHAPIHISGGSILIAEDQIGVRRMAEKISDVIEKRVKRAFRE